MSPVGQGQGRGRRWTLTLPAAYLSLAYHKASQQFQSHECFIKADLAVVCVCCFVPHGMGCACVLRAGGPPVQDRSCGSRDVGRRACKQPAASDAHQRCWVPLLVRGKAQGPSMVTTVEHRGQLRNAQDLRSVTRHAILYTAVSPLHTPLRVLHVSALRM